MTPFLRAFSVLLLAGVAACSSGIGQNVTPASPANPVAPGHRKASIHFSFKIPYKKHRRTHGKHAKYISPSTESMQVTVFNATHTTQIQQVVLNATPGPSPTSAPCTSVVTGSFACAYNVPIPPGNDTLDVIAFDQTGAQGNQLSSLIDYPITLVPGSTSNFGLTLEGILAKVAVTVVGSSPLIHGDATSGLQIAGIGSGAIQNVQLTAQDADGNVIVYATSPPALTLTTTDTAKVTIAAVDGAPGQFSLKPLTETNALASPDPATAITLDATGTPVTGSPVTTNVRLHLDPVTYAGNAFGNVFSMVPWSAGSVLTMSVPSLPGPTYSNRQPMAIDAAGNLYVAWNAVNELDEYAPGSNTKVRTITGITNPGNSNTQGTMAVDTSGNIFLIEGSSVMEYATSSATPVRTLTGTGDGIDHPEGLAVDSAGNLYVGNSGGMLGVSVYPPSTSVTTPSYSLGTPSNDPGFVAFDSAGNLYVTNTAFMVKTIDKKRRARSVRQHGGDDLRRDSRHFGNADVGNR
jgi:hypothetical protein